MRPAEEVPGCVADAHGSEHVAVPHRDHQGAAQGAAEGDDRQRRADLHGPHAGAGNPDRQAPTRLTAAARRRRGGGRAGGPRGGRRGGSRWRRSGGGGGGARRGGRDAASCRCGRCGRCTGRCGAGRARRRTRRGNAANAGPNQCHDITLYPGVGLAGGACGGYGLLLDIREAAHPVRMDFAGDPNMAFWHSATFSNDGTKVLFSDEWGGGGGPKCRAKDRHEWGGNALFTIEKGKLVFHSYYKIPGTQTDAENCVAHNGSLIPIPGRDVMVQGFYQGGITVFDWTDVKKPYEIAFFDRGPVDPDRLISAGSWSVYWYNGVLVSSEIRRGLDILELVPSPHLSQNEIDAAKTVRAQPPQRAGPAEVRVAAELREGEGVRRSARALEGPARRRASPPSARRSAAPKRRSGGARRTALTTLATQLTTDAAGSTDRAKVADARHGGAGAGEVDGAAGSLEVPAVPMNEQTSNVPVGATTRQGCSASWQPRATPRSQAVFRSLSRRPQP